MEITDVQNEHMQSEGEWPAAGYPPNLFDVKADTAENDTLLSVAQHGESAGASMSVLDLLTRFYYETLRQPVLVDVGAGDGDFSEPFATGKWQVVVIEPDAQKADNIRQRLTRFNDIHIVSPPVEQDADTTANASYSNPWSLVHISQHMASLNLEHISLLKITVGDNSLRLMKTFDYDALSPEVILCRFAADRSSIEGEGDCHGIAQFMASSPYTAFIAESRPSSLPDANGEAGEYLFHRLVTYSPDHDPEAGYLIFIRNDKLANFKDTVNRYHNFYNGKPEKDTHSSLTAEQAMLQEYNKAYEQQDKQRAMALLAESFDNFPHNESIALTYIDNLSNGAFPTDADLEKARQIATTARKRFPASDQLQKKAHFVDMLCAENRGFRQLWHFKNEHMGERCVIIGNGPSLNKMDLSFLQDEICFGFNRIYLGFEKWGFVPTYYMAVNNLVIRQYADDIAEIPCTRFLSSESHDALPSSDRNVFLRSRISYDGDFSRDPRKGLFLGSTVTYVALQMAYYMGFKEVVLIGVDHNFKSTGQPHSTTTADDQDPDHFTPGYWGKGKQWQLPDLDHSAKMYAVADKAFQKERRRIIDATVDGHCPVFEKGDYRAIFFDQSTAPKIVVPPVKAPGPAASLETETINFIDVGSAGEIPAPWDKNPHRLGRILKFEPRDSADEDPNITTMDCALWEKEEERPFYIYEGLNGTGSSLFQQNTEWVNAHFDALKHRGNQWLAETWHQRGRLVKTETLYCRTLDNVLADLDKPFSYDFLKIDAQGAEYNILRGAENYLATSCIGLHLELFVMPLYKGIKLLHEVAAYLKQFGFKLVKQFPPHGSFHSQHDCLFLKSAANPRKLETICQIYKIDRMAVRLSLPWEDEGTVFNDDSKTDGQKPEAGAAPDLPGADLPEQRDKDRELFTTRCPSCKQILEISQKGKWQCPACKTDFMV